jgi:hypothetical protein
MMDIVLKCAIGVFIGFAIPTLWTIMFTGTKIWLEVKKQSKITETLLELKQRELDLMLRLDRLNSELYTRAKANHE